MSINKLHELGINEKLDEICVVECMSGLQKKKTFTLDRLFSPSTCRFVLTNL
jgi:hypothetical protein